MSANQQQTPVKDITANINDISIENKRSRLSKLTNGQLGAALYHTYSITLTKQSRTTAAWNGDLPDLELILSIEKNSVQSISDEHLGEALYQMYCG